MDLASPAVSGTSVYANGLTKNLLVLLLESKAPLIQTLRLNAISEMWNGLALCRSVNIATLRSMGIWCFLILLLFWVLWSAKRNNFHTWSPFCHAILLGMKLLQSRTLTLQYTVGPSYFVCAIVLQRRNCGADLPLLQYEHFSRCYDWAAGRVSLPG